MEFLKFALLGYPLSHTVSPAMHNAALQTVGLDGRYEALPVEPARLSEVVMAIRNGDYAGANVTVPHKEAVIPLIDGLTPVAQAIGAVNTLVKKDGRLIGHNTDAAGLLADLYAHDVHFAHRPVLLLGSGGAARAIIAACTGMGVQAELRVIAMLLDQAETLKSIAPIKIFPWAPLSFLEASDNCALIIHATPLGMKPKVDDSPWPADTPFPPDAFVYDLVYNPAETSFTRQARAAGLRAATGLGMLVEQGALSFELWTGKTAPRDVMRKAAEKELK